MSSCMELMPLVPLIKARTDPETASANSTSFGFSAVPWKKANRPFSDTVDSLSEKMAGLSGVSDWIVAATL